MNVTELIALRKKQRHEFMTLVFVETGGRASINYRIPFDGKGGIAEKLSWLREDALYIWRELYEYGLIEMTNVGDTWLTLEGIKWLENADQQAETAVARQDKSVIYVGRDYVSGDKMTVGNISDSTGIAVGTGASANKGTDPQGEYGDTAVSTEELKEWFAQKQLEDREREPERREFLAESGKRFSMKEIEKAVAVSLSMLSPKQYATQKTIDGPPVTVYDVTYHGDKKDVEGRTEVYGRYKIVQMGDGTIQHHFESNYGPLWDVVNKLVFVELRDRGILKTAVPIPNDSILTPGEREYRSELLEILRRNFGEGDLKTLYFDLGWEYGQFESGGKDAQARALVEKCFRGDRQNELVDLIAQYRPNITLPKSPE